MDFRAPRHPTRGLPRMISVMLAVTICAGVLAACGGGSAAPSGTGSTAINIDAQKVLDGSFAGFVDKPPATGPRAIRGKTVWLLSCAAYEGCQRITRGFMSAAAVLGWDVKLVDTKADPNLTITAINQAVSAHADGIVELPVDCPLIKSGLLAAKAANIPVISYGGLDCNYPAFHGGDPLFAAEVAFMGKDWADFYGNQGLRDADFVLAEARKAGIAKPQIISIQNHDQTLQDEHARRFTDEIKEKCPGCLLYELPFTIAELTAGKGTQIYKSGLLAHPTANILYYGFDSQLPAGLQSAIKSSTQHFTIICCGDGGLSGLQNVRDGVAQGSDAYPFDWGGWAVADTLNRVFAGDRTFPSEGGESLFVDSTHNVPPADNYALGSFDYSAAYKKLWMGT